MALRPAEPMPERPPFGPWLWASFGGWVLGFVLVLAGAVGFESLGLGHTQFMVGVGMGLGVGLAQARVARGWMREPKAWVVASTVGMGGAFIVVELLSVLFGGFGPVPVTVPALVCGSICVGALQRLIVRESLGDGRGWVLASILGWGLAGAAALGGPSLVRLAQLNRWIALGLTLTALLGSGLVLGAITGAALRRRST